MSRSVPRPADAPPAAAPGGDALDDIRILLDGLAPAAAPVSLASTTIEMAAVSTGGQTAPHRQPPRRPRPPRPPPGEVREHEEDEYTDTGYEEYGDDWDEKQLAYEERLLDWEQKMLEFEPEADESARDAGT